MSLRHLFGPVTGEFADQFLSHARQNETCLTFGGAGTDLTISPADTWTEIRAKLPAGWEPEAVALWLPYTEIPAGLWAAPIPVVGLAADWNLLWHAYRSILHRCDLVLTDLPGVEALQQAGYDHVRPANLFGLDRDFLEEPSAESPRDIDLLFVGNFHPAVQRERLPWLARLARLGDRWNVHIATGVFGKEYRDLLRRARIVFNRSIRGECNKRVFEAAACGAMLVQESENREIREWLDEGTEFVAYTADNLESQLEHYLSHEEERAAVAEAARRRVQTCGFESLWSATLEQLREEWPALTASASGRLAVSAPTVEPPAVPIVADAGRVYNAFHAGRTADAVDLARRTLAALDRDGLPPLARDAKSWTREFDTVRVEWERAGWMHADDLAGELRAKADLLRWHLRSLLADLTGDVTQHYEAVLARPDLPTARAAVGCALACAGRFPDALPHLRAAVTAQPFDRAAARALAQVLSDVGEKEARTALEAERRLLAKAAPGIIPVEDWFAAPVDPTALASIVILCCNEVEATRVCLESVRKHTRQPYELILIDNGSADATPALLAEAQTWTEPSRVEVIRNEDNRGYPAGVNQGLAAARGEFLVLLNNDTAVTRGWLDGLIRVSLMDGSPALVGPVSNYAPEPQFAPAGYADLTGLDTFSEAHQQAHAGQVLDHPRLTGFCMLIPRRALLKIGTMDERYGAGFFDDDDLCLRARQAGLHLRVAREVYIHHEGSRTFRALGIDTETQLQQNFERFREKWGDQHAAPYRRSAQPGPQGGRVPVPTFSIMSAPWAAPSTRPRVSLTMMVKNEEKNLADCLNGVRDLVHEMVIVDTGSTDRTKEIAIQMGAKVFDFVWVDSFSAARNEALRHATGDWIFWLDGDDRLDEPNRQKLRRLFDSLTNENAAYSMKCRCVEGAGGVAETIVDHVRLFRNDPRVRWRHRVHEQILMALRDVGATVQFADAEITHVGYADPATQRAKAERNLRLLLLEYREMPDHPFTLFNLGSTYLDIGQPAEALPYLHRSVERSDPTDSIVRKLYALIAGCHLQLNRPADAIAACTAGRAHYPDDAELLYREGMARRNNGDPTGAEACYRRLIDGREAGDHFGSTADGLRGPMGRNGLASLLFDQKRYGEAEAQWRAALMHRPGYRPALCGLGDLYLQTSKWELLEQVAEHLGDSVEAAVFRGRARLARKEYGAARWVLSQAIAQFPQHLAPRVYLSHTLLQEGKDWSAADRALRDILVIDPNYVEAQNNLELLLREHGQRV